MQIVGYETAVRERGPALILAEDGDLTRQSLDSGTTLAYRLGDRHCAGRIADGRHVACGAATAPYCDRHTDRWPCARCRGRCSKPLANCEKPHALYLAAFAPDVVKVGVTKIRRLRDRLHEQGADRAAYLEPFDDGRLARRREAALAERLPDRVRTATKLTGLHRSVDEAVWQRHLDRFDPIDTYRLEYGLELDRAPIRDTRAAGRVRGTKGRILVLSVDETTYGVDLRQLVGYRVEPDAGSETDRQAQLGTFS